MKNVVVIVNSSVVQAVTDLLRESAVTAFTVTPVEGHGLRAGDDDSQSIRDRVVGFVPEVRIDIILPDAEVASLIESLSRPDAGLAGHGTFWVLPIEQRGRF